MSFSNNNNNSSNNNDNNNSNNNNNNDKKIRPQKYYMHNECLAGVTIFVQYTNNN